MPATVPDDTYIRLIESVSEVNGRYQGPQRLGKAVIEGNFSLLFSAYDPQTSARVALKFLHPYHMTNPYRHACFSREATVLEQLRGQTNILSLIEGERILEIPVDHGGVTIPFQIKYFATELADGNLRDFIYSPANAPLAALILFREVCMCFGVQY